MAHRHKMHHKGKGGRTAGRTVYAGKDSNVAEEAHSTRGGFKKGGKVHGKHGKHRLDKRARGGRTAAPFSSAHHGHDGNPAAHPHPHHSKHHGEIHTGPTHHQRPI